MKIKEIVSQSRRDFQAVYECENCGVEEEGSGYDDDHFHRNVIPTMKCKVCGQIAPTDYVARGTKYAAHEAV